MDNIERNAAIQAIAAMPSPDSSPPDQSPIDWSAALENHRGWLRSVLAARLGDQDAVDEVFQEVAVAAVSGKSPPSSPDRVAPWLYQVAVRRALMYRRSKGRQRRLVQSYAERHSIDNDSTNGAIDWDPLVWLLSAERQSIVRQAIANLHRRDREMLLLKYTQDWSYAQIAEHLGVNTGAVESRLRRARQKLRDELATHQITTST